MRPLTKKHRPLHTFRPPNALEWLCVCAPALVFLTVLAVAGLLALACNGGPARMVAASVFTSSQ